MRITREQFDQLASAVAKQYKGMVVFSDGMESNKRRYLGTRLNVGRDGATFMLSSTNDDKIRVTWMVRPGKQIRKEMGEFHEPSTICMATTEDVRAGIARMRPRQQELVSRWTQISKMLQEERNKEAQHQAEVEKQFDCFVNREFVHERGRGKVGWVHEDSVDVELTVKLNDIPSLLAFLGQDRSAQYLESLGPEGRLLLGLERPGDADAVEATKQEDLEHGK